MIKIYAVTKKGTPIEKSRGKLRSSEGFTAEYPLGGFFRIDDGLSEALLVDKVIPFTTYGEMTETQGYVESLLVEYMKHKKGCSESFDKYRG